MNKIILVLALLLLIIGCTEKYIGCQDDAKLCPDGSSVARVYPDCEFAECLQTVEEVPEFVEEEAITVDLSNNLSALKQEIGVIYNDQLNIGKEHYERLKKELIILENEGYNVDGLKEKLQIAGGTKVTNPQDDCERKRITLNYPPFDLDKVVYITPLGQMSGSHVTPVEHQYYNGQGMVEVYAPADGTINFVQHMTSSVSDPGDERFVDDYLITIKHTCTMESHFIHVDNPIKEIVDAVGDEEYKHIYLDVEEGQLLGTYEGTVDYNVFDNEVKNNFVNLDSYSSTKYSEVQDPFNYFNDEIRTKLRAKSLRSVEPLGGKIDYDIDGKLVGTWFEEGTNGHQGVNRDRYWAGHLSFAYNHIDPSLIVISIGTFQGQSKQFAVRGNSPDPAEIGVSSGLVKYELVNWDYYHEDEYWDRGSLVKPLVAKEAPESFGVVLVEMLEDRKIKFEAFPFQANSFTGNAKYFVR